MKDQTESLTQRLPHADLGGLAGVEKKIHALKRTLAAITKSISTGLT